MRRTGTTQAAPVSTTATDNPAARRGALARLSLVIVVVAALLIVGASAADASGYHSCPDIPNGGPGRVRVKRTSCRTARFVLRHVNHPGWSCHNVGPRGFSVVCKHRGGKVIRATAKD